MPKLDEKKEAFAKALAIGTTLREAAKRSGYAHTETNKGYLSRLSRKPEIATRIDEIRRDRAIAFAESDAGEVFHSGASLAELGLTQGWCISCFREIYERSREAGNFSVSNAALANIQKAIEAEQNTELTGIDGAPEGATKIGIKETVLLLSGLRDLMSPPEVEAGTPTETKVNLLRHRHDK